jgi:RNA polymerase sigma factor (sigma-70 family)
VAIKAKKNVAIEGWSVAQLSAFYAQNRTELVSHANRILKDRARAEEVSQEALIKFMLAAPELSSHEHALSYLHRTIENLCIDLFRAENRRPNLVALDDASAEVEANWQVPGDHSEALSAAEDAAIVRQALSLLSSAERAALVMWEMEGRSTQEIAKELGIKESAVRHTVSRARASLRKVLSTLVVDEKRGLTALDLLSTSYKKASEIAHKSGRVAMSLVLLVTAFLGFNSMTGTESIQTVISSPVSENSGAKAEITPAVEEEVVASTAVASKPTISAKDAEAELEFLNAQLSSAAVMLETLSFIEERTTRSE